MNNLRRSYNMKSKYTLLCSPYRYIPMFASNVDKEIVEKNLLNVKLSDNNIFNRGLIRYGLNANYGISNSIRLVQEIESFERGEYRAVENVLEIIDAIENNHFKQTCLALYDLANGMSIQGFDDCRIIDVLTKAYTAELINEEQFDKLFSSHTERIERCYTSWEQYLASCVLGKILQLIPESDTVVSVDDYLLDIYSFCIAPTNVFVYGDFWENHDVSQLINILEKLLDSTVASDIKALQNQMAREKQIIGITMPTVALTSMLENSYINFDEQRYQYLTELAEYVLWNPLISNNLEWMISEKNGKEQKTLLLPKEFASFESAKWFWDYYKKYPELHDENIFAMFEGVFNITALFTEKAVYQLKKKLLGKATLVKIPWEEADLKSLFDFDLGTNKILLNNKAIIDVFAAVAEIGLTDKEIFNMSDMKQKEFTQDWVYKMNTVLLNIPKRIQEFKKSKSN